MIKPSLTHQFVDILDHTIDVTVVEPSEQPVGNVLFLHGAGESTKDRCLPLASALAKLGYRGITFSYPGHGESSGELLGSSLTERKLVSEAVAKKFGAFPASMLVAVSMGAHTAISMSETIGADIEKLALLVPAVYSEEAENLPFGPKFSEAIRKPKSYLQSRAWDILPAFKGKLVTIQTGQDTVIPPEIYDQIQQSSTNASEKHHIIIPDSPHKITNWLSEKPGRVETLAKALDTFNFDKISTIS